MASISYEYTSYGFTRKPFDPVSEEEYNMMKDDIGHFIEVFYHNFKKQKSGTPNPHRFNKKLFFILILVTISMFGMSYLIEWMGYPGVAEGVSAAAIIPIFAIIFQPIQYFMSGNKSAASEVHYRRAANMHFRFHDSVIDEATDYNDYLRVLKTKTVNDFEVFVDRNQ